MTIEEKAEKEYPYVNSIDYPETCSYNKTSRNGFIHGAWWMLEKAADWIGNYLMEIGYPDDWLRDSPNMESGKERFRKAMEE